MEGKARWKVLVLVYFFMLVFAVTFQSIPPVLGFIVSALKISHAQAGALMSLFALPGILISIPTGILTDVYGPKRVGIVALSIALVGTLLVAVGDRFSVLVFGRIVAGIGALPIAVVASQTLAHWFADRDLGKAMGVYNTVMPLATIFTLNVFGRLAGVSSWRLPILLTAVYCLLVLVLFYRKYPGLPKNGGQEKKPKPDLKKSIWAIRKIGLLAWLVPIIWMLYNASAISYLTFGGAYYVSVGYDPAYAGFLTSLIMIGALVFSPLVGQLADQTGKNEYLIIIGCTVVAIMLFLVPRTELNPLLLGGLIGLFAAFTPAPTLALVPKFLSPEQIGLGYGISSTCLNIGVLIGPLLIGFCYDWTHNYLWGFNLMAIFAVSAAVIALLLHFISKSRYENSDQGVEGLEDKGL